MRSAMVAVCACFAVCCAPASARAQFFGPPAAVWPDIPLAPVSLQRPPTMVAPDDDDIPEHDHGAHDHSAHDHVGPAHNHAGHSHGGHGHTLHGGSDHAHGFDTIHPYESHERGVFEAYGHAGHTSIEGYPFVHGIRTEIDFIERALEWDLVPTRGADGGEVDELEFESELVWALNSRMVLIIGAPLISLNPDNDPNTAGVGDLELGFQFLAYGGENSLLFTALNMSVPTGDADRDLGSGHTKLEPTLLWLYDFRQGTYVQSRFGWEVPVSTTDVASEFRYDIGLFHTFLATRDWRMFRFFTPIVELNGVTQLNEDGHGTTVVDMTGGVRWLVRGSDEIGIGVSAPITGRQNFDEQVILSYRLHF